jgi:hypothetical protein
MSKSGSLSVSQDVYIVGGADLSHPYDCSVYLVDGDEEMVLIDSGAGEGFDLIVDNIRSLGLRPEKLKAVIATHSHIDHIGALYQFRDEYGVEVIAHELDTEAIETGIGSGAEYYGVSYQPCKVDVILRGTEETLRCGHYDLKVFHSSWSYAWVHSSLPRRGDENTVWSGCSRSILPERIEYGTGQGVPATTHRLGG